jgi:hypothetical protein
MAWATGAPRPAGKLSHGCRREGQNKTTWKTIAALAQSGKAVQQS